MASRVLSRGLRSTLAQYLRSSSSQTAASPLIGNNQIPPVYSSTFIHRFSSGSPSMVAQDVRVDQEKNRRNMLRPLSPHLTVYQPHLNSTLSICNRISAAFLSTIALGFPFVCLKMGSICFTYQSFYQFLFYSSKLIPISIDLIALALAYHLCYGVQHLLKDLSGRS